MPRPPRHTDFSRLEHPLQEAASAALSKAEQKDKIFQHFQEIFEYQIDADVIHMVLAECDWEEEKSMDTLLLLSQDAVPQRRIDKEPDLALIACSLIDETKETPTPEHFNEELEASIELSEEPPKRALTYSENRIVVNTETEKTDTNEINVNISETDKDLTMKSHFCAYPDNNNFSNVSYTTCDISNLQHEHLNQHNILKPVMTGGRKSEADPNIMNLHVGTDVHFIDREHSTDSGNGNRCISDKSSGNSDSEHTLRLDAVTMNTLAGNKDFNSDLGADKVNETFLSLENTTDIDVDTFSATCSCSSAKMDDTVSWVGKINLDDDSKPSVTEDGEIIPDSCALETKTEDEKSKDSSKINCGKDCTNDGPVSLQFMKKNASENTDKLLGLQDTKSLASLQKTHNFADAYLSPDAPEFIPSYVQSSQPDYQDSPAFLTQRGSQNQSYSSSFTSTDPGFPSMQSHFPSGHLDYKYHYPSHQIILQPIPVSQTEFQLGSYMPAKAQPIPNQASYSQAAMNDCSPDVAFSRVPSNATYTDAVAETDWLKKYLDRGQLMMVILRGLPGCGKSTLARKLKSEGIILSTDDFFVKNGIYNYDINLLSDAHEWNKTRALKAMEEKINPVIIDNTNSQMWEMIPYVKLALKYNYQIEVVEPDTSWKGKPAELARKNTHGVTKEAIKKMKQRYECKITAKKLIAYVKDSEKKKIQENLQNVPSKSKSTNDLSFPGKQLQKEPPKQSPIASNQPPVFSSYTSLMQSQKQNWEHSKANSKKYSESKSKTKTSKRQHQNLKDNPSASDKHVTNTEDKIYKTISKENQVIGNDMDCSGVLQSSGIIHSEDYVPVYSKPHFGKREKDEVVSTLEDFLNQGEMNKMSEKDWQRREDELEVLLQISPVNAKERREISQWLASRMKHMRTSRQEAVENNSFHIRRSQSIDEIHRRFNEEDNTFVAPEVGSSELQVFEEEHKCSKVNNNAVVQNDYTSFYSVDPQPTAEKKNAADLMMKAANVDDGFVSLPSDSSDNSDTQDSCQQLTLSQEKSKTLIHKTDRSLINLNSAIKDDKLIKKDINSQLLDVSTCIDFSENKESMLAEKQEVSNKAIPSSIATDDSKSDMLNTCATNIKENDKTSNDKHNNSGNKSKFEAEYWSSGLSRKASVGKEDVKEWDTGWQKPKPQRERKHSERLPQKARKKKVHKGQVELLSTEAEHESIHNGKDTMLDIPVLGPNDQEKVDVTASGNISSKESEITITSFDSNHIEQHRVNGISVQSFEISDEQVTSNTETGISHESEKQSHFVPESSFESVMVVDRPQIMTSDLETRKNVEETTFSHSSPKASKRKSKRKMAATDSSDFLGSLSKEKYETSNWRTFDPAQSVCTNFVDTEPKPVKKAKCRTSWTLTTANDFNVLDGINRDLNVSCIKNADRYTILLGKERSLNESSVTHSSIEADHFIAMKFQVDKSTMTDNIHNNLEPDIEFLKTSFPDMSEHQLWEVLEMCQNDVEWSVNLLLDWGVDVPLTPVDKQEIAKEMLKQKQIINQDGSPQLSMSTEQHTSSLFDLCSKVVITYKLASWEEMQQSLIKDSYSRLQRMESHTMEKMLRVSYDRSSSYISNQNCQDDIVSSDISSITTCPDSAPSSEELSDEKNNVATASSEQSETAEDDVRITLPVTQNLVNVLENLFGPAHCRQEDSDEFEVSLDLNTARLIHSCLQRSMQSKSVLRQLKEDEAMARQLQQEEKLGSVKRLPTQDIYNIDVEPLWQHKMKEPVKLKDIIKEENDKHILRVEQQKLLEESDSYIAVATKLKRQKLYNSFPGVDENFLEEIFQANGFSLEDTLQNIQNILGVKERAKSSVANDAEFDDKVVEQTTGQNLEESNTYIAVVTKLKRQKLYNSFPGVDEDFLEEIFQANGFSLEDSVQNIQNILGVKESAKSSVANDAEFDDKVVEQTTGPKEFQDVHDESDFLPSYAELRAEGTLYYKLRNECFSKAQQAYHRGMKDVACFYSQQGHLHTEKLKEAHMRASQKLLESRNDDLKYCDTLDLHGFHVTEAISTLQQILKQRETDFQQRPDRNRQILVIITGTGRHSQGGVAKIRPAVANYLTTAGYRFTEERAGIFKVQLRYHQSVSSAMK